MNRPEAALVGRPDEGRLYYFREYNEKRCRLRRLSRITIVKV